MDVARLNFSHGSHEEHGRRAAAVRAAADECDRPVAILQDLCGPKIRCGCFPRPAEWARASEEQVAPKKSGTLDVTDGQAVDLVEVESDRSMAPPVEGAPPQVPIHYACLAEDLRQGDEVLLDDGRVTVHVGERVDDKRVRATVMHGGTAS